MTSDQVRTWGKTLTPLGCAMLLWQFNKAYMNKTANLSAFNEIATSGCVEATAQLQAGVGLARRQVHGELRSRTSPPGSKQRGQAAAALPP